MKLETIFIFKTSKSTSKTFTHIINMISPLISRMTSLDTPVIKKKSLERPTHNNALCVRVGDHWDPGSIPVDTGGVASRIWISLYKRLHLSESFSAYHTRWLPPAPLALVPSRIISYGQKQF
jgi:hypothetical protein